MDLESVFCALAFFAMLGAMTASIRKWYKRLEAAVRRERKANS